ncbi:MAG: GNAT family N-acetyltransferase [Proteobacteria bacterium]|nr:GNAT family N-acetyltransferase [Pseudomonadota bacterium]
MTRPPSSAPVTPEALRGRYPDELERTWQPAGAHAVTIRALRHADLALERRFIEALSPETLYLRVQYFATTASERDLERLLDLDYYDRLAVGGITQDATGETLVGVSRYARIEGMRRAECAIVVADGWQGRGLGTELMRTLATAAQARAIDCLEGTTLAENARIAAWARRFGFSVRTEPNSGGLVVVRMDLQGPAQSAE